MRPHLLVLIGIISAVPVLAEPPWDVFHDVSSASVCEVVNTSDGELVVLSDTGEFVVVTGVDRTLDGFFVDLAGSVFAGRTLVGYVGFAEGGDGLRTVWWLSDTGNVMGVNPLTGEPFDSELLPSDFIDAACDACPLWDDPTICAPDIDDIDEDGVADSIDVCCNTPLGIAVDTVGRPTADLDKDCDVDTFDFATFQRNFTGELETDSACPCELDADCDDGLFCTGPETCDFDIRGCVSAGNPCAEDETCDEESDTCLEPGGRAFTLTPVSDTLLGGSGTDVFLAHLEFAGGVFFQTLNNGDRLDGGRHTDKLEAEFRGGGTTTPAELLGIEAFSLDVTDANNTTLNMLNADAVASIGNMNSQADLTITNVATAPTAFSMANSTQNFSVTVAAAALSGEEDVATVTLSAVVNIGGEPVLTLQPSAVGSGYETINIVSQGGVVNSIQDLQQGNGNSLTSIVVTGSADLDMNATAVDTTVTNFDASGATGDVDVLVPGDGSAGTAITVKGGSGDDDLACTDTADENFTVDGGAGNDKITFNANYDSTSPFKDIVDGGAGTDTLVVVSADAVTTTIQTNVSNIETLQVSDALGGNLDALSYWGSGITKVTLDAGIDGTARTITLPNAGTLDMNADAGAATHVLQVSGTGTSDAVTLDLASGVDFPNPLTVTGIEILTIAGPSAAGTKNDFGNTLTMTASAGGSTKIIITGANEVEFSAAITAGIIDGSACTGTIDIQANMAAASSILGGSAADTLTGSDANDVISGGAGADIIDGQDGEDTLTGGTGADTFYTVAGDQSTTPSSTIYTTITDFESDTDIIDDRAATLTIASGTTGFAATVASISSEGFCTFNSADDTLQERIVAAEAGIAANGVAAAGQFAIFELSSDTYILISEGTDGLDAGDVLLKLAGVTGLTDTTLSGGNLTIW